MGISNTWVLLDTCSTDSVMRSKALVSSIKQCETAECLTILTNGGSQFFEKIGQFKFFPLKVYFNEESMANILSMKDVASIPEVRVIYDSSTERMTLINFNNYIYKFKECREGLYYFYTTYGPEKYKKLAVDDETKKIKFGLKKI